MKTALASSASAQTTDATAPTGPFGFANPMGTDGFEFVEYAAPNPEELRGLFERMGFPVVAQHRSKDVTLHKQGDIHFIINAEKDSFAQAFARVHGPCACAMAFRVKDAAFAFERAKSLGAKPILEPARPMELAIPAIEGIGGSRLYLVDRYGEKSIYDVDFNFLPNWQEKMQAMSTGLTYLDHLTHNVHRGQMQVWADFYEKLFNFREIRFFDIEGQVTGLISKALTSPCGKIRIPLNESKGDPGKVDQIEEFLQAYNGEGIQHIALGARDLYQTVDQLSANGIALQDTIETYYDLVDKRLPDHGEPLDALRARRILIDGSTQEGNKRLLLQIFSKTVIGPIFFEFIQRKGDEGFGEGNFKALFESLELDQIRRGVLKA
jgi:4-hydroxyphenylpyruvate dioxygenase